MVVVQGVVVACGGGGGTPEWLVPHSPELLMGERRAVEWQPSHFMIIADHPAHIPARIIIQRAQSHSVTIAIMVTRRAMMRTRWRRPRR